MAPAVVYLHIGSPKTGTTYLQSSLWANEAALASAGVLLVGRSRTGSSRRVTELLDWKPAEGPVPRRWRALAADVAAWNGHSAIISNEHLYKATAAQWAAIVEAFPESRIEVVLTLRDLARSVPAQWQSSVRQRFTWTLGEYADEVAAVTDGEKAPGPAFHFWRRHDAPSILRRYLGRLPLESVRVVTVPPTSDDPDELWRRFCQACELDATTTTPVGKSHESLGAASSELMRRLNVSLPRETMPISDYKDAVNEDLSRRVLALRRDVEPRLGLPERHRAWAEREAERVIAGIEESRVEVIGDLDDLRPRTPTRPADPEEVPVEDLLDAAVAGLAGLALNLADLRRRLDAATRELEAVQAATAAAEEPAPVSGQSAGFGRFARRGRRG